MLDKQVNETRLELERYYAGNKLRNVYRTTVNTEPRFVDQNK